MYRILLKLVYSVFTLAATLSEGYMKEKATFVTSRTMESSNDTYIIVRELLLFPNYDVL